MTHLRPRVLAADHHRNGSDDGVGFHVAIVEDRADGEKRRMLVVDFDDVEGNDGSYIAVFDLDQLAAGNVYMHPHLDDRMRFVPDSGNNAWRGPILAKPWRQAVRDFVERSHERLARHQDRG